MYFGCQVIGDIGEVKGVRTIQLFSLVIFVFGMNASCMILK
jgi:hypothetical protein